MILRFLILCLALVAACSSEPPQREAAPVNVVQALSDTANTQCYARADAIIPFEFPRDHGVHPDFRTEWWYYTGNLTTEAGRHFGFQLTFFRQALACDTEAGPSAWRTAQIYFAHFALTDSQGKAFHAAERMNRDSLDIAGASPERVWIDDWQALRDETGAIRLLARARSKTDTVFALDLSLTTPQRLIRQGKQGLSAKGPGEGNASYYYSLARLESRGRVHVGDGSFQVNGLTWFDHEWSTTALGREVGGWDWMAGHLDDGRDLMVCRVRRGDGSESDFGFGSLVHPDGRVTILGQGDFSLTPQDVWTSPETGIQYPSNWDIRLPGEGLSLTAVPVIPNQEHTGDFTYWEGAVDFKGMGESAGVSGRGYMELTGY